MATVHKRTIRVRSNETNELEEHDVQIEIDVDGLAVELGRRAVRNRSGKAGILQGKIRVTHIRKGKQ